MKKEQGQEPDSGKYKDQMDAPPASDYPTVRQPAHPDKVAVHTTVPVYILASVITQDEKTYYPAVTVHEPLTCYLVPTEKFQPNPRVPFELPDPDDKYTKAYDWADELDKMFPSLKAVKHNALISFWRAGAYDKKAANKSAVRGNMFNSAYPYKLESNE